MASCDSSYIDFGEWCVRVRWKSRCLQEYFTLLQITFSYDELECVQDILVCHVFMNVNDWLKYYQSTYFNCLP